MSSLQKLKDVYEFIKSERNVNIYGPRGVGKTWIAKTVSDRCTRETLSNITLCVLLSGDYDKESLLPSIGRQLCLLPNTEEWEAVDESEEVKVVGKVEKSETLSDRIKKKLKGCKIILVLDDAPDDKTKSIANEKMFWEEWNKVFPDEKFRTIFISRESREDLDYSTVNVGPWAIADSVSLFIGNFSAQSTPDMAIQNLGKRFVEKSDGLPGTVIMIAKYLNYFGLDPSGVSILEKELEKAPANFSVTNLVHMKGDVLLTCVLKDLYVKGDHFFRDSGCFHYNELIAYWILEGYMGSGGMTELYDKGHRILMYLRDCGILKEQDNGYLSMDKLLFNCDALSQSSGQYASLGLANVFTHDAGGFGKIVQDDGMLKTPRTVTKGKNKEQGESSESLLTVLLDGTHFSKKVELSLIASKKLQNFALFNPTIESLPEQLAKMSTLRVLVLRGCAFLKGINLSLKELRILEVSGARSLIELEKGFFKDMLKLESLNLSELQITSLPSSMYELSNLQRLLIKDCPKIKKIGTLAKLKLLMVLDLSGNTSLKCVHKDFLAFKNLRSLNLSNTCLLTTPLLRNIGELTHLLLRDCKKLGRLRSLTSLTKLQTLDLSGSTNFDEFYDLSLKNLKSLGTLDLSGTTLDSLPSNVANPRHLYLKSCLGLRQLWCMESLVRLEELDLSGSKNLTYIEDGFFNLMKCLQVLNLSETNVASLPSFSRLSNLRKLLLSRCSSLKALPSLEYATKLEVLDASECSALKDIQTPTFKRMTRLQKLDLSETKINFLPALCDPSNLRHLSLKNCTSLKNLELNVSLLNLEVLNLSGISCLAPNGAEAVENMSNLQILDLSGTPVEQLPSMSKLKNLTHLNLAGCRHLETVPDLIDQTKLEVLDLSGSSLKRLPNSICSKSLRKLLLKDCFFEEEDVPDIQVKDLQGPTLKIPHGISELIHIDYLEYPNMIDTQGVESSSVRSLMEEKSQDQWNICQLSDMNQPPLFFSGTQFLTALSKRTLPEGMFHLCAFPATVEGQSGDPYFQRRELVFADVYFQNSQFAQYKKKRSLQIRGFEKIPKSIEETIHHVDLVLLFDDRFKSLRSGLNAYVLNKLKGCWVERCHEMVSIFDEGETEDNTKAGILLENLGVSNNRRLVSIYKGGDSFRSFSSLKSLYIDRCPELTALFPSACLPETLEVLQIKYCDKLVSLFEGKECELQNLVTLHLWELSELKSIGCSFPSLQNLHICECPNVEQFEDIFEVATSLKTIKISGATSLKSLYGKNQDSCNLLNLETLKLESCQNLENVISSSFPLEKLKMIEIRDCKKLQTLFAHNNPVGYKLPCLKTLHLEDLPMLKRTGLDFDRELSKRFPGVVYERFVTEDTISTSSNEVVIIKETSVNGRTRSGWKGLFKTRSKMPSLKS